MYFIHVVSSSIAGLTCHDCSRIPHPADCGHVMECEANSVIQTSFLIWGRSRNSNVVNLNWYTPP